MKKLLIIIFAVPLVFAFSVKQSQAESFLGAGFAIYNDPTFGFQESQYAPSTLKVHFWSYSQDDSSATTFKFDCDGNGSFDVTQTVSAEQYKNKGGKWYTITTTGPPYSKFVIPDSPFDAWWAQSYGTQGINCSYQNPGDYTLRLVAVRGGVEASASQSFTLRPSAVDMIARPFYKERLIDDFTNDYSAENGTGGGNGYNNIPKPPAVIDWGVAIWNPLEVNGTWFPLNPSSGGLKIDCDSDGTFDYSGSFSSSSTASQALKGRFCSYSSPSGGSTSGCQNSVHGNIFYYTNACNYTKPGIYKTTIRAELGPNNRDIVAEIPVVTTETATVAFSTGSDPITGAAPFQGIDLKVDVKNLIWTNASYNFNCGNGQSTSSTLNLDSSKRYYDQDYSVLLPNYCNYPEAGEYLLSAQLTFNTTNFPGPLSLIRNTLPTAVSGSMFFNGTYRGGSTDFKLTGISPNYLTYTHAKDVRILVTGKLSGGVGGVDEYMVTSPFDMKWNSSRTSNCSILGVGNSYQTTGTNNGSVSIQAAPGDYTYKLTCGSSGGTKTVEKLIKVKVRK